MQVSTYTRKFLYMNLNKLKLSKDNLQTNEVKNMKRIIATLCILMIAIIGVSAVAASADADNASNVELEDIGDYTVVPIDDASASTSEDPFVIPNSTFKNCTAEDNGGAIFAEKTL